MQFVSTVLMMLMACFVLPVHPALAGELILLEQKGCIYCKKWDAEIGLAYPNTEEGKLAPLRKVDIDEAIPEDLENIRIERFTPTFVLIENGREVGRIRGYPGDEFFWFLLGELLDEAKAGSG